MPKKDQDDSIVSETGNWNVADSYSKSKIMRPLVMCDFYEDVATFGYDSLVDELMDFESPPNDLIKIKAIQRLIKELIRLIDNAKFALKKPGTKDEVLKYREHLVKIETIIPKLIKVNYNEIEHRKSIMISNETLFYEVLKKLSDIKSKINEPLNKNHLIFTDKEEFDPKAFKDKIKRRMIEEG